MKTLLNISKAIVLVFLLTMLGVALFSLTGCGSPSSAIQGTPLTTYAMPGGYDAYEFNLKDGTRCVSIYGGGIVCEWPKL